MQRADVNMMTPIDYYTKIKEIENAYWDEVKKIEGKYDIGEGSISKTAARKDEPEGVKKARKECENCSVKYHSELEKLKSDTTEEYNKLVEDSENYQKLKGNQSYNKGDKRMEIKDEKDLEEVFGKLLNKHNKNSQFENTIKDMHSKISKIDSIEGKLIDIIPKVQKIDSICEDGRCFKTELSDIKKDLAETKKGRISAEVCTDCGERAVVHSDTFLASHCANCGAEVPEWNDDDGTPVANWKNYKLRGKK